MATGTALISDFTDPRFRTAFQTYFSELGISVSDWDGLFREMNGEGNNLAYLLLDDGGHLLGFLMFQTAVFSHWFFEEPVGFIREFWIDPAFRQMGYGVMLLTAAEQHFVRHGVYRAILTADNAVNFYLARGYQRAPGIKARNNMEVLVRSLSTIHS